ncbi:protein NUCLEAR FUSION DEFECTIVE 2 isoform X1 [Capsicum annuum]|uniref:protein NUCLEAR FUSION DEFECTIVE 2 isoform X1 n=1 Tax=Capsicum annuum TaxID=4072 RepID=UPI001FB15F82|nr:protein NUCLEAR FUSION DEFECTIVE 2 isoform X1 [Capsicum annuum]
MWHLRRFICSILLALALYSSPQARANPSLSIRPTSPFSIALETLQNQIQYTFQDVELLRRALTHASYSGENNRALSILGEKVIEGSVSLQLLSKDIDMPPKDLNRVIVDLSSNVVSSCVADGGRLGLQKIIRVSRKTNSSAPAVVCGAFRAVFGAIAIDKSSLDSAGKVFLTIHGKGMEKAMAM